MLLLSGKIFYFFIIRGKLYPNNYTFDLKISQSKSGRPRVYRERSYIHSSLLTFNIRKYREIHIVTNRTSRSGGNVNVRIPMKYIRMVLLKKYGVEGFTFYTNYTSRKADELDSNPRSVG